MQFEDAVALAARVRAEQPAWEVIAIGRFVPVEDLSSSTPWRVSVNVPGFARPRMLNCENDLKDLVPKPIKPVMAARPSAIAPEGMLF